MGVASNAAVTKGALMSTWAEHGWSQVATNAAVWLTLSIAVGFIAARLPDRCFVRDNWLTRPHAFERSGNFWKDRLRINRWKDHLPEAGAAFGGRSKRRRPARADLQRAVLDTRRAELVHWTLLGCGPLFLLLNPPALSVAMIGFGVVANVPCLLVQRYNRARMVRMMTRYPKAARRAATPATSATSNPARKVDR